MRYKDAGPVEQRVLAALAQDIGVPPKRMNLVRKEFDSGGMSVTVSWPSTTTRGVRDDLILSGREWGALAEHVEKEPERVRARLEAEARRDAAVKRELEEWRRKNDQAETLRIEEWRRLRKAEEERMEQAKRRWDSQEAAD